MARIYVNTRKNGRRDKITTVAIFNLFVCVAHPGCAYAHRDHAVAEIRTIAGNAIGAWLE